MTALQLLGKKYNNLYYRIHLLPRDTYLGEVHYPDRDSLYREMRNYYAYYYACKVVPNKSSYSKWDNEYNKIASMRMYDIINHALLHAVTGSTNLLEVTRQC